MKFISLFLAGLAVDATVASTWFSKAVYNKWHETELERWLSDHNIPYPAAADRKDLEILVKDNWQSKIASPYSEWNTEQLTSYLKLKGIQTKEAAEESSKDGLLAKVKANWYEAEDKAEDAWSSVKEWIFDSWSDSQLKTFADKHGIPVPQPKKRDTVLQTLRSNYETIAKKVGETASYPGNWLYESWSESDLKEWLDVHGIPAPQPTSRDKLVASVRRNSRIASLKAQEAVASASSSAAAAAETASEKLLESWSDSQIKEWADKNGIRVPQGSKRNELLAIARKHRAQLTGDTLASSASSAFGAATSAAGNQYAKATDSAQLIAEEAFNSAIATWSDSRLKAYLDARGVPVPQSGKKDEILAAVRLNMHKAATGYSAWTFDTWTYDNLKAYLLANGDAAAKKAANKAEGTRDDLVKAAHIAYASASKTGGTVFASATSYLAKQTDAAKDATFETWSDSELKSYLDSYGVPVPQGSTKNEIVAYARNTANYFKYGTTTPQGTMWVKLKQGAQWVKDQLSIGAAAGRKQAVIAGDAVKEAGTKATNRAEEAAQRAAHKVKEEL